MALYTIALFGEAEKGEYHIPYLCNTLDQLVSYFGQPPRDSKGLDYAVQALLYQRNLLFFRVREEGFSEQDYYHGVNFLKNREEISRNAAISLAAICIPGVGNSNIIEPIILLCIAYRSILITTQADFYDYLTMY